MQFNKNKSNPSILSIVNVVFTRKNQNFWKKAPTILLIKARPEVWTIIGRRAAEQDGVARRRQLTGLFVDAPRLHGSSLSHEPGALRWASQHANCLMPQPPPPICGGNICSEGNQCNILLITRRPGRDEDIIYLLFRVNWTGPCHYRLITSNDNANGIPPWGWELSQLSKMYRIWGGKSIYFLV